MPASSTAECVSRIAIREGSDQVSCEDQEDRVTSSQRQSSQLVVGRRDIEFTDVGPRRVRISITVTNLGRNRSRPAPAFIQAAPFGAFVNWQPLTVLTVPPLDPGESTVLQTEAARVVPLPLGSPIRVPPGRILTALGFNDTQPRSSSGAAGRSPAAARNDGRSAQGSSKLDMRGVFADALTRAIEKPAQKSQQLPASLFDLLTGRDTYWAGNLNVFIGGTDVERHVAKALRIVPGRTNAAMFVVGDGGPECYRFDLVGLTPDWEGAIFDPMNARSLALGPRDGERIEPGSWRSLRARSMLLLALKPPMGCVEGNVQVHVTQRSTQKTAVVEFSFDPRASGPGCYMVE
jgi:hypothetical protein